MEITFMIIGFLLAAYSVVGNDVIQTLGTFLSSNEERPWWVLWLFTGSILTAVLVYGWYSQGGDVSYGRLETIPHPSPFAWWYILPPLTLMIITRFGIPVSTTFLILSVFSSKAIIPMLSKSLLGYVVAFVFAIVIFFLISKKAEQYFLKSPIKPEERKWWTVAQWISTGALWSVWLIQDLANIYVYLPRDLGVNYLIFSLIALLALQAYIFYSRGGNIQKIVKTKTNTSDIRSATIIDFIYAIVLFIFKELSNIPMSTTWVFIGLLAGRELMINYQLSMKSTKDVFNGLLKDLLKVALGLVVSVLLVFLIQQLRVIS